MIHIGILYKYLRGNVRVHGWGRFLLRHVGINRHGQNLAIAALTAFAETCQLMFHSEPPFHILLFFFADRILYFWANLDLYKTQ